MWSEKHGFRSSTKKKDKETFDRWKYGKTTIGPAR